MTRPIQLKITDEVSIILDNVVSYAIERGLAYRKLKEGKDPASTDKADYDVTAADTVSFFFPAGNGLNFRVGEEITPEDFARINATLKSLEFHERKPSSNEPPKGA